MSSIRENQNEELTTDACPSPPRDNKENSQKNSSDESENKESQYEEINTKTRTFRGINKPRGFTKVRRSSPATAYPSIININNSKDVHVGANITYNLSTSRSEKSAEKSHKEDITETNAIKSLRADKNAVTREDLLFISTHMDETWQDVARALNFSEGQIQQCIINHKHLGVKEIIYQLLLDWMQNEPTEATICNLSNILWENNQRDVVKRWSEKNSKV